MRRGLIVVVLVFIAILAIYYTTSRDAFTDLNIQRQNRTNPLAARQHPLTNPAAKIGTNDTSGSALRKLTGAAFSLPFMNILGHTNETPLTQITPRIDEEGSFLDEVNFCEKRAKISTDKKANPFKDPEFKAKCGMCMTTGTLANGKKFTKPTGILVYDDDKTIAREAQKDKAYRYPRLVPSLKSAKCQGEEASFSDDSRLPVVIIDDDPYDEWTNNLKCQEEKKYNADKSCGLCVVNPVQWATVSTTTNISSITLTMVGQGIITITTKASRIIGGQSLSLTSPLTVNLGTKEDDDFIILVAPTDDDPTVVLGAYVKGKNPDGTFYYLDLLEILTSDEGDVSKQITLGSDRFVIGDIADITAIAASPNPSGLYKTGSIALTGKIPFTFTKGQFADMLCPGGPYTTSEENQKILGISDPCLEEGQGPGKFSKQCIQTILRDAGCYQGGDWWNKGLAGLEKAGLTVGASLEGIKSWMAGIVKTARRNPDMSMGCYGIDVTTPCDAYVGTDAVPSDECLAYMYSNKSENSVIGRSYITENFVGVPSAATSSDAVPKNYRSMNNLTDQYCQPKGEGNPEKNPNSLASLREVAKGGFDGKRGIEAVKMFLTKQYDGAVGTGRVSVDDVNTGPKAKWDSCFGVGLLPSDLIQSFIAEPGDLSGGGTGGGQCKDSKLIIGSYTPAAGKILASNINMPTDYIISFDITMNSTGPLWGEVLRFGTGPDCCQQGYRSPLFQISPNSTKLGLIISSATDSKPYPYATAHASNGNWNFPRTVSLQIGKKTSIQLKCIGKTVTLTADGSVIASVSQPGTRYSGPLNVYGMQPNLKYTGPDWLLSLENTGDTWEPAKCLVENLTLQTNCNGGKKCTYGNQVDGKFNVNLPFCPPGTKSYDPNNGQELPTTYAGWGSTRCVQMTFGAAKALCDTSSECIGIHAGRNGGTALGYEPHGTKSWAGVPGESTVMASYGKIQGLVSAAYTKNWDKISCDGDAPKPTPTPTPTPTLSTQCFNTYVLILGSFQVIPAQAYLADIMRNDINTIEKQTYFCQQYSRFKPDGMFYYPANMVEFWNGFTAYRAKYPLRGDPGYVNT